jgi:DNA-binding IscR family transcriptional regulator
MEASGNGRLVGLSRKMVVATNAVLFLAEREDRSGKLDELEAFLGTSREELWDALASLAREGIVRHQPDGDSDVALSEGLEELTFADIARATGRWMIAPAFGNGADPTIAGLDEALSLVRHDVLLALDQMRVLSYVGTAR